MFQVSSRDSFCLLWFLYSLSLSFFACFTSELYVCIVTSSVYSPPFSCLSQEETDLVDDM